MKFLVLAHNYNDSRSWWEPYHGDGLVEFDTMDEAVEALNYDGLYKVLAISEATEVQVSSETVRRRDKRTLDV
jgi:hypothetical protein